MSDLAPRPASGRREAALPELDKSRAAWEVYLYARDLVAKRMSYGMVAQSMLLIAFSTLASSRASGDASLAFFQCVVAGLGIIYSAYQYFMVRNLNDRIQHIQKKYLMSEKLVFADYLNHQPRQRFSGEFSHAVILVIFLLAWIVMLVAALVLSPP